MKMNVEVLFQPSIANLEVSFRKTSVRATAARSFVKLEEKRASLGG